MNTSIPVITKFGNGDNNRAQLPGDVILKGISNEAWPWIHRASIVTKLLLPKGSEFPDKDLLTNPQTELVCHMIHGKVELMMMADQNDRASIWTVSVGEEFLIPQGAVYRLTAESYTGILCVSVGTKEGNPGWHPLGYPCYRNGHGTVACIRRRLNLS